MTRAAIVGLANTHPFAEARHLGGLRPDTDFVVMSHDGARVADFVAEHPGSTLCSTLDDVVGARPDVALVTVPPHQVTSLVSPLLDAGIPVEITKPAITSRAELARLEAVVEGRESSVFTASVLRFAPDLARIPHDARHVHVVANHHIDYWLNPGSSWQDEAGGLVPMMGVHAFEILEHLLGPTLRVTACGATRIRDIGLASPDIARGAVTAEGRTPATFEVNGTVKDQSYVVAWSTDAGSRSIVLGESGDDDPLGFRAMAEHVLAMADGAPSPLPWKRSRTVLRAIADARKLSERGIPRNER